MDIGYILIVLGVIFFSMTLHELMHGIVANKLGDETARLMGRLTLNPFKHVDPFMTILLPLLIVVTNMLTGTQTPIFGGAKPVPFNPARIRYDEWGVALMAISGPLTNLLLAFLSFWIYVGLGGDGNSIFSLIARTGVVVNLGFFVFNMIPLPPLDGSRVLYAIAPDVVRNVMDTIERYGIFVIFFIIIVANSLILTYMATTIKWFFSLFAKIFGVA